MPNLDGGHYFLTVLAPIRTDAVIDKIPGRSRSHRGGLAQKLALLATGRQTESSPKDAWASPFSRNLQNHLARFVIIDGPAFNGRVSGDTLLAVVRKTNPLTPQPVDRLTNPYLLFAADLDQAGDAEATLRSYTDQLWATMNKDLVEVFGHCVGFEGVDSAETFNAYIRRCQVETTMPFNDYWPDGLKVGDTALPTRPLVAAAVVAGGAVVLWVLAAILNGLLTALGAHDGLARMAASATAWGVLVAPLLVGVALLFVWGLYRWVVREGSKPFGTAPGSDLPSVLKSLFVQQQFTRFAIEAQGLADNELHSRFGAFLKAVQPAAATPAQPPGEVASPAVEWTR
ncbi:MAG TPA: hypothetical protein VFW47_14290 [Phenylobacterium sp.]|nr:hypothetical protein [Phenylobacterium sp.]